MLFEIGFHKYAKQSVPKTQLAQIAKLLGIRLRPPRKLLLHPRAKLLSIK